jgi:hypothetical protein
MLSDTSTIGDLDRIKLNNGNESLKNYFHNLLLTDSNKAINLINDEHLNFSSLFILRSIIKKFNLASNLNNRNKYTIKLINQILIRDKINLKKLSTSEKQNMYLLLRWIVETGFNDDGLNNQYDEVLDAAVLLLIKVYNDKTILNIVVEMIFNRNRKKYYNYDLIWGLFESREPKLMFLVANRLTSNHWMDIELSRKLLKFIPDFEANYNKNNLQLYNYANKWLQENYLFLNYTGESFQQSCNPKPYILCLEAKYLCKPVLAPAEEPRISLSDREQKLLDGFKALNYESRNLLSRYSYSIYRQNIDWWRIWINYPVATQIRYAKNVGGLQ